MGFLPPSGGVVRLAPFGGPGQVFHADGHSVLKVQTGNRTKNRHTNRPEKLSLLGRLPVLFYVAIQFVLKLLRLLWVLWESSRNIERMIFDIQLFGEYTMRRYKTSTISYAKEWISAGCNKRNRKFCQNAKREPMSINFMLWFGLERCITCWL